MQAIVMILLNLNRVKFCYIFFINICIFISRKWKYKSSKRAKYNIFNKIKQAKCHEVKHDRKIKIVIYKLLLTS